MIIALGKEDRKGESFCWGWWWVDEDKSLSSAVGESPTDSALFRQWRQKDREIIFPCARLSHRQSSKQTKRILHPLIVELFRQDWFSHVSQESRERGCSSVGRTSNRHAAEAGSIPRCGNGFFSQSQLSVQIFFGCPHSPRVQSYAFTSVRCSCGCCSQPKFPQGINEVLKKQKQKKNKYKDKCDWLQT